MGTVEIIRSGASVWFDVPDWDLALTVLDADALGGPSALPQWYQVASRTREDFGDMTLMALGKRIWSQRVSLPFVDAVIVRPSGDTWWEWELAIHPLEDRMSGMGLAVSGVDFWDHLVEG